MPTVSFTGVKSCTASSDAVDVVFTTRYSGDLSVTMTRTCLGELVAALSQDPGVPTAPQQPSNHDLVAKPAPAAPAPKGASDDNIAVRVPKKWAVAAETKMHNVVLLFLDPGSENQSRFALSPKAATEIANALIAKVKVVAEAVAKRKSNPPAN